MASYTTNEYVDLTTGQVKYRTYATADNIGELTFYDRFSEAEATGQDVWRCSPQGMERAFHPTFHETLAGEG